ncbi:thiamine-phosphate kinase [Kaarinaea lacus]
MISSEFDIIRRFFSGSETGNNVNRADVTLGIGDDAALLTPPHGQSLVVTADTLVSGVHFPEDTRPESIAHKSLAVNLSDLAAMGAEPAWFTLCITLPHADEDWLVQFAQGLFGLASEHGIQLVGGDTTHGPLSITIQAMGFVPDGKALRRAGARPGDAIYVTGTLGDAAAGLQIQQDRLSASGSVSSELLSRLERPVPRISAGMALRDLASAAIDISDGLSADLGHIIDASKVGADVVVDDIPLSEAFEGLSLSNARQLALSNGDDYELCFTVPAEYEKEVQERLAALDCRCTRIGTITPRVGAMRWLDTAGIEIHWKLKSYDHFSQD